MKNVLKWVFSLHAMPVRPVCQGVKLCRPHLEKRWWDGGFRGVKQSVWYWYWNHCIFPFIIIGRLNSFCPAKKLAILSRTVLKLSIYNSILDGSSKFASSDTSKYPSANCNLAACGSFEKCENFQLLIIQESPQDSWAWLIDSTSDSWKIGGEDSLVREVQCWL